MIFQTIFMYLFISSACLIYGIGVKDLLDSPERVRNIVAIYVKTIIIVCTSIFLNWLILRFLLIPYGYQSLFPFMTLVVIVMLSVILESLWPSFFKMETRDLTLVFFAVFLGISEGATLTISLTIGITVISAFYLLLYLLYSLNRKNSSIVIAPQFNTTALMLTAMSCIILALYGWNVSWLSQKFFN